MSSESPLESEPATGDVPGHHLSEADARSDPIDLFRTWFSRASESDIILPESVALATATADGRPSVRMVLLKEVDERGFVFFTNYESRKASELVSNPRAALCFHWALLERQVRVNGPVTRVSADESSAYFRSRGRGSRLGAWASMQSRTLENRETLERRLADMTDRFPDEVPLPPHWGGYRIDPEAIEFWQGRADRLHDRLLFTRDGDGWATKRLYP